MSIPVVVGVDGSESALHAVRWAADEARRRQVPLRLVHAYEIPVGYPPGIVDWHTLQQALAAQGRTWLDQARQAADEAAPGLAAEIVEVEAGAAPPCWRSPRTRRWSSSAAVASAGSPACSSARQP